MTMTDYQVQKLRKLRLIEKLSLPIAAVKSGMSEKTDLYPKKWTLQNREIT